MSDWAQRLTAKSPAVVAERAGRVLPALAAGGVCLGILLALAWDAGGYFPAAQLTAGTVAFGVLAVLLAVRPPRHSLSTPSLVAISGLTGLALWTGLSARWSSAPDSALEDMQRGLLYVGVFALGLVAAGSGRYARQLVWGALAVIAVVCGAGLLSRLAPDWVPAAGSVGPFDDYRLGHPLTYWNAFGALGAMGVVLAAGLAADGRTHPLLRGLSAGAAVVIGVAAYLSFSRGAWLAFGLGVLALVAIGGRRVQVVLTLGICGAALAVALARLRAYPGLTEDPGAGAGQLAAGDAFLPWVVGLALAAAVGQVVVASIRPSSQVRSAVRSAGRRIGPVVALLAVLGGAVAYVAEGDRIEAKSAGRLVAVERWVDRQWDEFMTPATFSGSGAERLTTARGTRSDLYRIAIDGFESRPLIGDGAGGFEVRFAHDRDVPEKVRDAHSLYLETLGELGAVGAILLMSFLGAVVWAAVGARRDPGALTRQQSAAVIAAVLVWMAHAGVDWDWQMPALTGTALFLAASLFPVGRSSRRVRRRRADA